MSYFKLLIYYSISVIDALINVVCALFGYYPTLEMAHDYLMAREMRRIGGEVSGRQDQRKEQIDEADALVQEAKENVGED